jgi:tetratricopeptide (TPR) repeat protein
MAGSAFGHAPDNEQIKRLDAEVRANPADASFLLRRAAVLRAAGRSEAAAEDYERALLLDPRNVEAHLGRAALLLEAGAIEEAQRTLEACPQGDEGFESQRWRLQSAILRSQQSWVAAAQALDRAIAIDSAPRPEDFMECADLALSAGDPDAALAALERGIERLNGAVALRWRAIGIAIRVQRTELALAQLDQLEQVMPESALVRARRGDVFAACGRHLEASAAWTEALERIDSIPAAERSAADQKLAERLRRELRQEAPR